VTPQGAFGTKLSLETSHPMELTHIRYETRDALAILTLDRPDTLNAYTEEMFDSIAQALDLADDDPAILCMIVTGSGSSFSAGGDLKLMKSRGGMFRGKPVELRHRYVRGVQQIPRRIARFEKPLIAAINGPAVGAGLDLACMCDIRIAARRSRFGAPFVKLGLIPGDGGAYFISRVIGFSRALELMLTGRLIDADEALRIGLVHDVVDDDRIFDAAVERAELIMSHAPLAVRLTKAACYQSWNASLDEALNLAATYQSVVQNTADHAEGLDAVLERRKPTFRGE